MVEISKVNVFNFNLYMFRNCKSKGLTCEPKAH